MLLKEESTITAKGQTTVPKSVRQVLGIDYGGRVAFVVDEQRRVYLEKAETVEADDPVVESFLAFLSRDMASHPERSVVAFPAALRARIAAVTAGMAVDPDAEIEGDVAL